MKGNIINNFLFVKKAKLTSYYHVNIGENSVFLFFFSFLGFSFFSILHQICEKLVKYSHKIAYLNNHNTETQNKEYFCFLFFFVLQLKCFFSTSNGIALEIVFLVAFSTIFFFNFLFLVKLRLNLSFFFSFYLLFFLCLCKFVATYYFFMNE